VRDLDSHSPFCTTYAGLTRAAFLGGHAGPKEKPRPPWTGLEIDRMRPLKSPASPQVQPATLQRSLRLHIWIPAWRARRRNDLQVTTARRRDLHLRVNARRRADDALRLGELIA
jgi:hypothetical protein